MPTILADVLKSSRPRGLGTVVGSLLGGLLGSLPLCREGCRRFWADVLKSSKPRCFEDAALFLLVVTSRTLRNGTKISPIWLFRLFSRRNFSLAGNLILLDLAFFYFLAKSVSGNVFLGSPETSPWVEAVQLGAMSNILGILGPSVLYESSQVVGYKASLQEE